MKYEVRGFGEGGLQLLQDSTLSWYETAITRNEFLDLT